jgi:hypothetical protein
MGKAACEVFQEKIITKTFYRAPFLRILPVKALIKVDFIKKTNKFKFRKN